MRGSIILLVIFIVTSCNLNKTYDFDSKKESLNNLNNTTIRLRWMGHWRGEGKKETMIREIARDFSFLNQDIEVILEFPEDIFKCPSEKLYDIQSDSMSKMVSKNEWPFDIVFCDQARYWKIGDILKNQEWGKAYLVDFKDEQWYLNAHKEKLLDDGELISQYGGSAPGPFLEGVANILYTSDIVAQQLGLQVKYHNMNINDFTSYAKAVFDYNKSHSDTLYFYSTQYWNATGALFTQLVMSAYGNAAPGNKELAFNSLRTVYNALENISKYKPLEQLENSGKESRRLFEKKYLFSMSPSWMYILWQQSNPDGVTKMKPSELPSLENLNSPIYSGGFNIVFAVPQNAKNKEAALRFIKYISSKEIADKWVKYSKCPTGLKTSDVYSNFGQDAYEQFYKHITEKYGNNQLEVDLSIVLFKSTKKIEFYVNDVLGGKMTTNDALAKVKKQL